MKLLCLAVILANFILLTWEYRNSEFDSKQPGSETVMVEGNEKIRLVSELKPTTPVSTNPAPPIQERPAKPHEPPTGQLLDPQF